MEQQKNVRIAALGDIHCGRSSRGQLQPLFSQVQEQADIVALCGDITDYGTPEEAKVFAKEFSSVRIPAVAVLGNHDYEAGKVEEVRTVLFEHGIKVLDGTSCELFGVGFAGVKGFAGGFGGRELQPWGETAIKAFVQEAVSEALKLESALSRLYTSVKIALLHYSPIEATVRGEPQEIYPFLGSSRLEEAINRYGVAAAFHGHAHYGAHEGQTLAGVPVFNVSLPVLRRNFPDRPAFKIFTVAVHEEAVHERRT